MSDLWPMISYSSPEERPLTKATVNVGTVVMVWFETSRAVAELEAATFIHRSAEMNK